MQTYKVPVDDNGIICWYNEEGKKHREDGPAVESPEGYKAYYINGKRHREDGPAIVYSDGRKQYCINGVRLSEEEFNNYNKKEMTVAEIEKALGYSIKVVKG